MTVSTHVYRAFIVGDDAVELSMRGGSLTLDESTAPHVQGRLEIAIPGYWAVTGYYGGLTPGDGLYPSDHLVPDEGTPLVEWHPDAATLTALDPREGTRIRVEVDGTYPSFSVHREFDLGLRDREVNHADGTLTLTLASDEGLLADYAPLADDDAPFGLAASLRDVVDYVLNASVPGAALEGAPPDDADVTPYWSLTNLLPNPSLETDLSSWAAGLGASSLTRVVPGGTEARGGWAIRWVAAAGISNLVPVPAVTSLRVTPGRSYVFTFAIQASNARNVRAHIQWITQAGAFLAESISAPVVASTTGVSTRVTVIGTAPAGAEFANPFIGTVGNSGGGVDAYVADAAMFYEGTRLVPYFDGASTSAHYTYEWQGDANASPSTRIPVIERSPDSLTWRAGQSALDFLRPLVQAAGLRLVCDEERRWTLRNENYESAGSLSIRHGVNLIDGTDTISRDSGLWFDARVTTYRWTDADGVTQTRHDAYALALPYTRLTALELDVPYPGPGRSEYAVRRAQARGRDVTATAVAQWTASAEQPATVLLENTPTQIGRSQRVVFDLDTDRMTVTLRTTDTPAGAINLLVGTVNALTGTVNAL